MLLRVIISSTICVLITGEREWKIYFQVQSELNNRLEKHKLDLQDQINDARLTLKERK